MSRNLVAACLCLAVVASPLANDPYDSSCPHPTMINAPPPEPAPGTFFAKRLTAAAKEDKAVCIDGTTPIVYVKPGNGTGSKKWYIHHEGGGWCNDLNGCLYRSETPLGSTLNDTDTIELHGGYFDYRPQQNPYMYNWNMAYLRYCDGGSFSGNNANPTPYRGKDLWFRGFHILQAVMTELIDNNGLKEATDVVISGCSAGGLATYLHADQWADKLRPILGPNARIKAMPDSGFFPDYNGPPGYENRVKNVSLMQNITAALPQECVKQYPENEVWKCFFAENVSPYIQTPVFPLQSRFDTWQIGSDLGTNETAAVNAWGEKLVQTIHQRLLDHAPNKHGIFLDSCAHHCGEFGYIYINGVNAPEAFNDWFVGTGTQHIWFQNETYPCSWCCKNPPPPPPKAA